MNEQGPRSEEPDISEIEQIMAGNELRLFELGLMKQIEKFIDKYARTEEEKQMMRQELLVLFDATLSNGYRDGIEAGTEAVLSSMRAALDKGKEVNS